MSETTKINEVIAKIENGTAIFGPTEVVTVDDLKAIREKTFKQLITKEPEKLYGFKNYVIYYEDGPKGKADSMEHKRQLYIFTSEEVVAAGTVAKGELGEDLKWISAGRGKGLVAWMSPEGSIAATNEKLLATKTSVIKIKALPKRLANNTMVKAESEHVLVPMSGAYMKWRGQKAITTSKKNAGPSLTEKALIETKEYLVMAKDNKNEKAIKQAEELIVVLTKQIEEAKK